MFSASPLEEVRIYSNNVRQEIAETNGYPFACSMLALDIADILLKHSVEPRVIYFVGSPIGDTSRWEALVPRAFEGRIRWGAHIVCEAADVVFDPINPEPVAYDEYAVTTFEHPAELQIFRVFEGQKLHELLGW